MVFDEPLTNNIFDLFNDLLIIFGDSLKNEVRCGKALSILSFAVQSLDDQTFGEIKGRFVNATRGIGLV